MASPEVPPAASPEAAAADPKAAEAHADDDDDEPAPRPRMTRKSTTHRFYANLADMAIATEDAIFDNMQNLWLVPVLTDEDENGKPTNPLPGVTNRNPIYTQVGWIPQSLLIAVNPHKKLGFYDANWTNAYRELGQQGRLGEAPKTLGPHCFNLAESAFQGLSNKATPWQSLICLGESGSGKTFNMTKMRNYLLDGFVPDKDIKKRMKAGLDLLNHFGNASTMYNDDATRFGSYTRLLFEGEPLRIVGARVETFLLESTRFSFLPEMERNFHVAHYLQASNPDVKFRYMEQAGQRTVNYGKFKTPPGFDKKLKDEMVKLGFSEEEATASLDLCLGLMYLGNVEFKDCKKTVKRTVRKVKEAAPAPAAPAEAKAAPEAEAAEAPAAAETTEEAPADTTTATAEEPAAESTGETGAAEGETPAAEGEAPTPTTEEAQAAPAEPEVEYVEETLTFDCDGCDITKEGMKFLKLAAKLLKMGESELVTILTEKPTKQDGAVVSLPMTAEQALLHLDLFSREIYDKHFDHLVAQINEFLGGGLKFDGKSIGLLDLGGFADRRRNYFEQLLLNCANEMLHGHFYNMLRLEKEEREAEGIETESEKPMESNELLVKLMTNFHGSPGGIIKQYDDVVGTNDDPKAFVSGRICSSASLESWTAGSEIKYFIKTIEYAEKDPLAKAKRAQLRKVHDGNERFRTVTIKNAQCFAVKHSLGSVLYWVKDFPESGPKYAFADGQATILDTLATSANPVLQKIASNYPRSDSRKRGQSAVSDIQYVIQNHLIPSRCLFMQCIRPNTKNHSTSIDEEELARQLPNCGIHDVLALKKDFGEQTTFVQFVNEFWSLERDNNMKDAQDRAATVSATQRAQELLHMYCPSDPPQFKVGKEKIFLQQGVLDALRHAKRVFELRFKLQVRRKIRAKLGCDFFLMILGYEDKLGEVGRKNLDCGVEGFEEVIEAMKEAQAKFDEAKTDPEAWEKSKEVWKECNGDPSLLPPGFEASLGLIEEEKIGEGFFDFIGEADKICQQFRRVVEENRAADKAAIEEDLAMRKTAVNDQVREVLKMQETLQGRTNEEEKEIYNNCEAVLQKLAEVQKALDAEAAEAGAKAMTVVDFATEDRTLWWTCPEELDILQKETVDHAQAEIMDRVAAVEEKRRKFREDMENESEVAELWKAAKAAKDRLNLLSDPNDPKVHHLQYKKTGGEDGEPIVETEREQFEDVRQAMNHAWEEWNEVEAQREDATDSELFQNYLRWFIEAEEAVQTAVVDLEAAIEEARRKELERKRAIYQGFDRKNELSELYRDFLQRVAALRGYVSAQPNRSGEEWEDRTKGEFVECLDKVSADVAACKFDVITDGPIGTGITLATEGPWSPERFKVLGPQADPYERFAQMLDEKKYTRILQTVDALNRGEARADKGFCMAWSETWGMYYLLYTEEATSKAMHALEKTKGQITAKKKEARIEALRGAIGRAVHELQVEQIKDRLAKEQAALEKRIHDEVDEELDKLYEQQAIDEAEANRVELTTKGAQDVEDRENWRQKCIDDQASEEIVYTNTINDLLKKLRHAEIRTGSDGAFPSLYAQLMEVWNELEALLQLAQTLLDHSNQELDDLREGIALAKVMADDPGVYTGLRDLVQVLMRCQKRHAEAENTVLEMGLELTFPPMVEARTQLTEVAKSVKNICDRTVTQGNGLEEELQRVLAALAGCSGHFSELKEVNTSWHLRLANAMHFVEQAMDFTDISNDTIEELKQDAFLKRGKMTDKMYSGILDCFQKPDETEYERAHRSLLGMNTSESAIELLLRDIKGEIKQRVRKTNFHLEVGDRVVDLATKRLYGTVAYLGPTKFSQGEWAGLVLDLPQGKHDGTVAGVRYFECDTDHGLFMRPNALDRVFDNHNKQPMWASSSGAFTEESYDDEDLCSRGHHHRRSPQAFRGGRSWSSGRGGGSGGSRSPSPPSPASRVLGPQRRSRDASLGASNGTCNSGGSNGNSNNNNNTNTTAPLGNSCAAVIPGLIEDDDYVADEENLSPIACV